MSRIDILLGAAVALALLPAAAAAEPGGQGKGVGKPAHVVQGKGPGPVKGAAVVKTNDAPARRVVRAVRVDDFFDRDDEALIRRYYGSRIACPPGLAAKTNGCLPPGQAKKIYAAGTILPRDIYLAPLPGDLLGRLPVAPDGYYYGRYNGDVYLVENATRRIVDTILFNVVR